MGPFLGQLVMPIEQISFTDVERGPLPSSGNGTPISLRACEPDQPASLIISALFATSKSM